MIVYSTIRSNTHRSLCSRMNTQTDVFLVLNLFWVTLDTLRHKGKESILTLFLWVIIRQATVHWCYFHLAFISFCPGPHKKQIWPTWSCFEGLRISQFAKFVTNIFVKATFECILIWMFSFFVSGCFNNSKPLITLKTWTRYLHFVLMWFIVLHCGMALMGVILFMLILFLLILTFLY